MNVHLAVYMPFRGSGSLCLTVSGVQTLIPHLFQHAIILMHDSYESKGAKHRDREGQPVCLARLEDSALNINNLSQVSVSHI